MFQHTAARRRLDQPTVKHAVGDLCFNTQPPEGGWTLAARSSSGRSWFQHTAARRRLAWLETLSFSIGAVSTHSRPKAAGLARNSLLFDWGCFNTQPPEGGWTLSIDISNLFNAVSTHSRPKAAGSISASNGKGIPLFQHTAARRRLAPQPLSYGHPYSVSTHSRPKAAGRSFRRVSINSQCFNTQPPEGGWR